MNEEFYDIDMKKLLDLQMKGAIVIDVRSPQEFQEGHLQNSICIPEYEMKDNAIRILENKEQAIVVYCGEGSRSKKAQSILRNLGFTNVYNLKDGIQEVL